MKQKARFVLNKKKLLEQYNIVKELGDEVSYSLKTNPFVGSILEKETKCLFSIHSEELVEKIKEPSRIWFFAQAWDKEEIKRLLSLKISNFVVDNESDLNTLIGCINESRKKINLLLRMKLKEKTVQTGKHFVFGMSSDQINRLVPELKKNSMIGKLGIHFHRKTQNISEWSLKEDFLESVNILDYVDLVDIGGGLPTDYKNSRAKDVLPNIFKKIKEFKEILNSKKIKMIIEPGRFLAAPCIKLECYIISIYDSNIIVDCSVYNSAMDTFIASVRMKIEGELESGNAYTIKGCTPDSMDILRYRVYLKNPKVGDKITFLNAGAYTFSTDFCNLKKLDTVVDLYF